MSMTRERAESIALKCLEWLAGHDDLWPVFLGSTGANETELTGRVEDPDLLAAVLDFILMDDSWVHRCCVERDLRPEAPMQARMALPGGELVHWT